MRKMIVLLTVVLAGLLISAPALAHVTVQPVEAVTGSFSRFVVRVPNERDDASTTRIEVQLPPLAFVSFQPKEGWERTVTMRTLDEPLEVFGEELTEVVDTVVWEGGSIAPGEFEEFGFSARMPENVDVLEFPAVQTYDSGEEVRWVGPEDAEEPAALVRTVTLAGEEGQLATLANLQGGVDGLQTRVTVVLVLSGLALVISIAALLLTLRRGGRAQSPVAEEEDVQPREAMPR
jgi:periplasmic copper chaperone A